MKLVVTIVVMLLGCAFAARYSNPYKNKRIIKVRVPPRQHTDFYNGPKGYLRPSNSPIRFKDYHYKHREFPRPSHQATYYSVSNIYSHQQARPPPQALPNFFSGTTFGKGYSKEIYHKFPFTYGSNYPHKKPLSSFKFPDLKDEIRVTHSQPASPSPAPALPSSSVQSSASPTYQPTSFYVSSPHAHVQSFEDNRGPIREIPAPDLGPKPADANDYATYGKGPSLDVTNLVTDSGEQQLTFPATEYYSVFGQTHNFDALNDNHLSTTSIYGSDLYKDSVTSSLQPSHPETGSEPGVLPTASPEIAFKNNQVTATPVPSPSAGYEVTEEQYTSGGATPADNSQYFYAPDPDPSLPVHKVPPTREALPEGKNIVETYIPQQNFQILEGGTVAAPITTLSTQELFQLMHGYTGQVPIVAEPVVTIVGHHQPGELYLQPSYAYAQTGNVQYPSQSIGNGQTQQLVVPQQGTYIPQQHYQTGYSQSSVQNQNSNEYQYEPEASESRETENHKETNENTSADKAEDQLGNQIIIHFNKLPEVPFYTTLPNKEAAEALASLQAAGSIGSNYVNQIKAVPAVPVEKELNSLDAVYTQLRGDQGPEKEEEGVPEVANFGLSAQQLVTPQKVEVEETRTGTLSDVEIQKSVPVFETSYPAHSLLDDTNASRSVGSEGNAESFGKRIRPK